MDDKRKEGFPIQTERGAAPHPLRIPWSVAEKAYSVYAAKYGRGQSLERLAERGGFGPGEMDEFLPGWRDEVSELVALRASLREVVKAWLYEANQGDGIMQEHAAVLERARTALGGVIEATPKV